MISKDDFQVTHYLAGFHTFNKDHNYLNFRGNLINDFSKTLNNKVLDSIIAGPLTILKSNAIVDSFEIQFGANVLTYQDIIDYKDFISNAIKLLNDWRKHSNLINLRLVGLVTYFSLLPDKTILYKENIYLNNLFRNLKFIKDLSNNSMTLTFNTEIKSELYTTQLKLNHSKSSNDVISGAVDLFKVSDDTSLSIDDKTIERIFTTSKSFFENQFIEILNIGL